jgi:hypothetical protein
MVIIFILLIIWYMVNNSLQIVHCHVKKSLTRAPIARHMMPVHSVPYHLNKIRFNIIPSTPRSFILSPSSGLPLPRTMKFTFPKIVADKRWLTEHSLWYFPAASNPHRLPILMFFFLPSSYLHNGLWPRVTLGAMYFSTQKTMTAIFAAVPYPCASGNIASWPVPVAVRPQA